MLDEDKFEQRIKGQTATICTVVILMVALLFLVTVMSCISIMSSLKQIREEVKTLAK